MDGFYNRLLDIDLDARSFAIEAIADEDLARTLGGKGLATRLLLERNPIGVDPLAPDNHLIFATGPLTGSRVWGGCRYGVYTKSPLTGAYLESYAGGKAPEGMDSAGFDAVLIHGKAQRPTALTIHPEGVTFHDASELWGMETYAAEDAARERFATGNPDHRRPGVLVIGPAGERLIRFACIENDYWRSAGRGGAGAVMGSKNLKALVFQGDRKRKEAKPAELKAWLKDFTAMAQENPGVKAYRNRGTTMMVAIMNNAGAFPAKYWSQGTCDHWEKLSGDTFHDQHEVKSHACLKCLMACGRLATIKSGRHAGLTIEGPEYETIYAFGGLCMIEDMAEVVWLNDLCDRLGMDTISAGNLVALAMEATEQGRLSPGIAYGDADAAGRMVQDIARREGLGAILAQGIREAAKALDMEDQAIHVKGMEPPGYDPRVLKGMGLSYATSDRGACHLRTTFYKPELSGMIPANAIEGKAEMLLDFEDRLTIFDVGIFCRFYRDLYTWERLTDIFEMLTGREYGKETLTAVARLVADMTREFNRREGLTDADDRLPKRLLREVLPSGHALTENEFDALLKDYYRLHNWS